MDDTYRIKRIQRWIGAYPPGSESGDLNDPRSIKELEKDIIGLDEYLAAQVKEQETPVNLIDKAFPLKQHYTPNKSGTIKPLGCLFHHSCGSVAGDIHWITKGSRKAGRPVSYHILIEKNGNQHQFVPLNKKAWHAGSSTFKGRYGCNSFMVGIAFTGDTNKRELTDEEISSAVQFVERHKDYYEWTHDWMTDHRTVSPTRKNDLHPSQWMRLRNALKEIF